VAGTHIMPMTRGKTFTVLLSGKNLFGVLLLSSSVSSCCFLCDGLFVIATRLNRDDGR